MIAGASVLTVLRNRGRKPSVRYGVVVDYWTAGWVYAAVALVGSLTLALAIVP